MTKCAKCNKTKLALIPMCQRCIIKKEADTRADERAKCNSTCDICKSTKNLSVSFCKKCIVNLETEAEQRGFQEGYNKGLKDNSLKTAYEDHSKNHRDGDTATKYCYFCACQANEKPKAARKKKTRVSAETVHPSSCGKKSEED